MATKTPRSLRTLPQPFALSQSNRKRPLEKEAIPQSAKRARTGLTDVTANVANAYAATPARRALPASTTKRSASAKQLPPGRAPEYIDFRPDPAALSALLRDAPVDADANTRVGGSVFDATARKDRGSIMGGAIRVKKVQGTASAARLPPPASRSFSVKLAPRTPSAPRTILQASTPAASIGKALLEMADAPLSRFRHTAATPAPAPAPAHSVLPTPGGLSAHAISATAPTPSLTSSALSFAPASSTASTLLTPARLRLTSFLRSVGRDRPAAAAPSAVKPAQPLAFTTHAALLTPRPTVPGRGMCDEAEEEEGREGEVGDGVECAARQLDFDDSPEGNASHRAEDDDEDGDGLAEPVPSRPGRTRMGTPHASRIRSLHP